MTMNLNITNLNTKAMTVRLTRSKPKASARDASAEQFVQSSLDDKRLQVSAKLFRTGPIRELLNRADAVYAYHKLNTLPYEDRGHRLLPVSNYEKYRDTMRSMISDVEALAHKLRPMYQQLVNDDIAISGSRAKVEDYPSEDEFFNGMRLKFTFAPLPDKAHYLFDVSDEDKAALEQQMQEVIDNTRAELTRRLRDPMRHLLDKLKVGIGEPGSVFRDSAVENVVETVQAVRRMSMDDPEILAACDTVEAAFTGHARNPQVLRESPIVREGMVKKLADIQNKMGWMNG